jgi:16S rRNA (cytosine967-C5)-methyltransferase
MKIPFKEHHLLKLLEEYSKQQYPLDFFISQYFRSHPALGSKDRAFIAETAYALLRWKDLLDYLDHEEVKSWSNRYQLFLTTDIASLQKVDSIPVATRVGCPPLLFQALINSYGIETARELCLISNTPAPTTIRVSNLKTNRDELLKKWSENYEVTPTPNSPFGIIFQKKINFFSLPEFKQGLFEIQDEGSQLIALLIKANPGDLVLDYCAGSGGKTLAFAPFMEGKGQIYLHDIRKHALLEARKRLKRAGIQNYQLLMPEGANINKLRKKMDWVLVDAPCSGTGTLRRNPDMKDKFNQEMVERLVGQQRQIFEKALSFLKPSGKIVYATCSILEEENEQQLEHFKKTYSLIEDSPPFHSLPTLNGMDGFFGVVFKRQSV